MMDSSRTAALTVIFAVSGLIGGLIGGACSFESGLAGAECEREGAQRDGRVCQNGYWVSTDGGTGNSCVPSEEECNERDDDCDGVVDEGCPCEFSEGEEGVCSGTETIGEEGNCGPPEGWLAEEGESGGCGDMLDNDCDGEINEECDCRPGETRDCYSGSSETLGVGACEEGTMTCGDDGKWGACEGQVTRRVEAGSLCGNGEDDDCDGVVDEECPCGIDGRREGVCSDLIRDEEGVCPEPEDFIEATDDETPKCDGLDNDCDGVVDEGCPCAFRGIERGICAGQSRQSDGSCPRPDEFIEPTDDETGNCDGLDNDCDGLEDEGCSCDTDSRECYTGPSGSRQHGPCSAGDQNCANGRWAASCEGETTPEPEICDNDVDDDCDGGVDEECPCNYQDKSAGVCSDQRTDENGECREPDRYMEETDDETPNCDGLDNDCDGTVDEGCPCNYEMKSDGVCGDATTGEDGECQEPEEYVEPDVEENEDNDLCDGLDNDCDGVADEDGCPCDYLGRETGVCEDRTITSQGNCEQPPNFEVVETSCDDGLDNDCDGDADGDDVACKKSAGESCSGDEECLGKCVERDGSDVCAQTIFVTSTSYDGDLGGLSGADAKCDDVVTNAGIGGNWAAVISDANLGAKSRITVAGEIVNREGKTIAEDRADLWDGSIENTVRRDEYGEDRKTYVWTGTDTDGSLDEGPGGDHCVSWSSSSSSEEAEVGDSDKKDGEWINGAGDTNGRRTCDLESALYCIDGQ